MVGVVIFLVLLVILAVMFIFSIKIVHQSYARVVERMGKYNRTMQSGVHFIIPFIESIKPEISLKEDVADFMPQSVITKDNVTMNIDTVVYYQVTDPKLFTYGIERPKAALENLTATTLRNIVGELELDETLTSRDTVNAKMRTILDEATDSWGIKVNRVELKNILPPKDIQDAMEKQMRAERERREAILRAEGEKKSSILIAEGEKEAAVLRAEAKRIALENEAQGMANAIKFINMAKPSAEYLTLQGYEALKVLANGNSTKIIVPSELQNVAGLLTSMSEVVKTGKEDAGKEVKVVETKTKSTKKLD
ncbi:MAG: SPFH/Band 7/PHB domain protein [Clostridia bacterium]|nr:SPFH/Band 7/PHB domain protein [Clostridia bacterium]